MRTKHGRTEIGFALLLLPLLLGVLGAVWGGPLHAARGRVVACLGVAGLAWLLAVLLAPRVPSSKPLLVTLVVGAVALRLAVFGAEVELSDDVHRYVWEGGVLSEGWSPYAHSPEDPELAGFRESWAATFARMNNPGVSAAYPPLTQYFCAAVVAGAGGPGRADGAPARFALRVAFALADLLVLVPLIGLLRLHRLPSAFAVVWAWCPLIALEFAGAAHFDSLGILLLFGALLVLERARSEADPVRKTGREDLSIALLAAGALVKFLPVCVLPFALRSSGRPVRGGLTFLVWIFVLLAPLFFFRGGVSGLVGGLSEYAFRWESFNLVFRWIEAPFDAFLPRDEGLLDPRRIARGLIGLAWLGIALRLWRTGTEPLRAGFVLIGAFLVLTPTLHPWYLAWIAPFLALYRSWAWVLALAAAPLLYWPLTEWRAVGLWIEPAWLWPAVAVPVLLVLVLEAAWRRRRANR